MTDRERLRAEIAARSLVAIVESGNAVDTSVAMEYARESIALADALLEALSSPVQVERDVSDELLDRLINAACVAAYRSTDGETKSRWAQLVGEATAIQRARSTGKE